VLEIIGFFHHLSGGFGNALGALFFVDVQGMDLASSQIGWIVVMSCLFYDCSGAVN
jgi:hypothetical protein